MSHINIGNEIQKLNIGRIRCVALFFLVLHTLYELYNEIIVSPIGRRNGHVTIFDVTKIFKMTTNRICSF